MLKTKIQWNAPTTNEDGSALVGPVTYNIYYGTASGQYTGVLKGVATLEEQLSPLLGSQPDGTYYVAVKTQNAIGNESSHFSNEVMVLKSAGSFFVLATTDFPNPPSNVTLV